MTVFPYLSEDIFSEKLGQLRCCRRIAPWLAAENKLELPRELVGISLFAAAAGPGLRSAAIKESDGVGVTFIRKHR